MPLVLLSYYLASTRGKSLLSGKNVLELGSGVGLPGFVASNFANKVLLTDGNDFVVECILKRSVSFYNTNMSDSVVVQSSSCGSRNNISVQQFVWGDKERLKDILEDFGTVDVIVAADVVQWPSVLEPLLNSCKALLWKSARPFLVLGLVQRAQSTYREFFKLAKQLGFVWEKVCYKNFLPGGVLPEACQEYGVGKPEIYEFQLTSRLNPPILLTCVDDEKTLVTGSKYQFSSLPC
jgi:predicted nicotinamide N-methyase